MLVLGNAYATELTVTSWLWKPCWKNYLATFPSFLFQIKLVQRFARHFLNLSATHFAYTTKCVPVTCGKVCWLLLCIDLDANSERSMNSLYTWKIYKSEQDGHHFEGNIWQCIFLNRKSSYCDANFSEFLFQSVHFTINHHWFKCRNPATYAPLNTKMLWRFAMMTQHPGLDSIKRCRLTKL